MEYFGTTQSIVGIDREVPLKAWIAAFAVIRDFGELCAPSH
jgi:hypothetical protein